MEEDNDPARPDDLVSDSEPELCDEDDETSERPYFTGPGEWERMTKAQLLDELNRIGREAAELQRTQDQQWPNVGDLQGQDAGERVPDFPAAPTSEQVRLQKTHTWGAFSADTSKIVRLEELVSDSLRAHYEKHVVAPDGRYHEGAARPLWLMDSYTLKNEILTSGEITRSGPMGASLAETDPTTVRALRCGNDVLAPDRYDLPELQITFGKLRSYERNRIQLVVSDVDRDWVAATFDRLTSEMKRSVPWWAYLRTSVARAVIGLLTVVVIGGFVFNRAFDNGMIAGDGGAANESFIVLVTWVAIGLAFGWDWLLGRFLLRPVDLYEPGSSSSAARGVAAVAQSVTILGFVLALILA